MHALITKAPGGAPFLRLEHPDFNDEIDSSKELRLFIAVPLCFSSFSICLAFVARGSFTYQDNSMTFNEYEINVEKLIRVNDLQEIKIQCQAISDKVDQRFENEDIDFYYFNSFSQSKF